MPAWLVEILESGLVYSTALVLFVLFVMTRSAFKAWPFVVKFTKLVHELVGDENEPGIAVRMQKQTEKLDTVISSQEEQGKQLKVVMHEVLPNHGSSLNDSVRRTEVNQRELTARLDSHLEDTTQWHPMLTEMYRDFNKKEES